MKTNPRYTAPDLNFATPAAARRRRFRGVKDRLTSALVGIGGISVIIAILLIFIYLLYEVMPLFHQAQITPAQAGSDPVAPYRRPGPAGASLYLAMEEQAEVALRLNANGEATFFATVTGDVVRRQSAAQSASEITAFALDADASRLFGLAHADGSLSLAKHNYAISYPNDVRKITPSIDFPFSEDALALAPQLGSPTQLALRNGEDALIAVASNAQNQLFLTQFVKEENLFSEELTLTTAHFALPAIPVGIKKLMISPDQHWLLVLDQNNQIQLLNIQDPASPVAQPILRASHATVTSAAFLLGGSSLMIGDQNGRISQWFMVRNAEGEYDLRHIRDFSSDNPNRITQIIPEHRRKGFLTAEKNGTVSLYNATAQNRVLSTGLDLQGVQRMAISPRADALLVERPDGKMGFWAVDNEHPEVSWNALWHKIWYEGYEEPSFTWQSSAATNDFEPKYSLMPLAFGTLKAAFYAMLVATPLAICGAIYTAYFMAPGLRRKIKPFIELMEALPTVILGFLAGLWLAPFIELHLARIFTLLLLVPIGVVLFAYLWQRLPRQIRYLVPEGWDAALLIPVIILLTLAAAPVSELVEALFFGGDMKLFITRDLGINFDQRNALVVGLAMGFAVIPTIFSITEDAIFSVPQHLSNGSLALGATPWQTLSRVVLPTASPGIFSAMMIGMGRAVGETMIVLMATGNTPIMDANIFEGMRTLAANIAVEMPESEVGSSHFRILFLAALVLFLFTFVVNTAAEIIRQRLRRKYGAL